MSAARRSKDLQKDLEPDYVGKNPSPRDVDMDVAVSPGTTRSSIVIQQRLMGETEYQAVLKLVEKYLPKFDIDNLVTAMHMCALAAKESELKKRQIIVDPNFAGLFNAVKEAALEDAGALSPRTSSDLLWSCAQLSIFDRDLFTELVAAATRRLDTFPAKGISMLAFALGWVGHAPRASFMQALVRELRARIDSEFDPRGLAILVYSMKRLGIRDERLLKIVGDHMLKTQLEGFERSDVIQLAYAFGKLEYFDPSVFSQISRYTVANLNELEPGQVVMVSLAFAHASGRLEEASQAMEAIKEVWRTRLGEMKHYQLASYAFALGKHKVLTTPPEQMRRGKYILTETSLDGMAIVDQVVDRKMPTFSVKDLVSIKYALMRLEHREENFLKEMAEELIERAAELTPMELVNAMYAFARVEFVHIPFVDGMVQEIKRRDMLDDMGHLLIATLVYSLAVMRIKVSWIMEAAAIRTCGAVREMSDQQVSMILWSMAVLDSKIHAEAVVSTALEDMSKRLREYGEVSIACNLWAAALLTGTSSALWVLDTLFASGFWMRAFEPTSYAMMYVYFAALAAEEGLDMTQVRGYEQCRGVYEELTGERMSFQNVRLADRLRMQSVPHDANAMPPALDGFREPGVRADIILENLQLIIEVEGPQRMSIPLEQFLEVLQKDEAKELFGKPWDVVSEARAKLECDLTGSAMFKRRVLRTCGWRVVSISFDENEEYVVDALCKMNKKEPENGEEEADKAAEPEAKAAEESGSEEDKADKEAPMTTDGDIFFLDPSVAVTSRSSAADSGMFQEAAFSEYEERLRQKHSLALAELERRITEVQGNAASASSFKEHFEYRRHQVSLEKEVFRQLVEAGV